MKKKMMTLITAIFVSMVVFGGNEVETEVESAFNKRFVNAHDVTWTSNNNIYKAKFSYSGMWMFAFYDSKAELVAFSRYISSMQLPYFLQRKLKHDYADYWVADLFEVSNDNGFEYYITLQQGEHKIMLVSKDGRRWKTYRRNYSEIINSLT